MANCFLKHYCFLCLRKSHLQELSSENGHLRLNKYRKEQSLHPGGKKAPGIEGTCRPAEGSNGWQQEEAWSEPGRPWGLGVSVHPVRWDPEGGASWLLAEIMPTAWERTRSSVCRPAVPWPIPVHRLWTPQGCAGSVPLGMAAARLWVSLQALGWGKMRRCWTSRQQHGGWHPCLGAHWLVAALERQRDQDSEAICPSSQAGSRLQCRWCTEQSSAEQQPSLTGHPRA